MAQIGQFNAATVPPAEPGMPVWEGNVPQVIVKTEIKPTAANDGQNFLALHVQAIDGQYKGQENVIRLNLYNRNAQAVDIAQRQLSAICHVTNRMQITDSDHLVGVPFIGVWAKEKRTVKDQQTGQDREIESCQCKDFRVIDGRTIRELLSGQPPANPAGQPAVAQQHQPAPAAQPAPQAGFQPPPPAPGFVPPTQASGASGGFAPPAHPGAPPMPAAAGFGTAGSGGSAPAFQPPAGGFGAPGAGAPAPAAPQGFQPPAGPQPGAGPWGPQR